MVIGQQFLMLEDNRNIQLNELSIHSFADGFSFCTQGGIRFFYSAEASDIFETIFQSFLDENQSEVFEKMSWVEFESPSLFVPKVVFDKKAPGRYLEHFAPKNKKSKGSFDTLLQKTLNNVYWSDNMPFEYLNSKYPDLKKAHANTLLFKKIKQHLQESGGLNRIYVNMQKKCFDLFVFEGADFKLCNRFDYSSVDEFMYFLFFVIECFSFEPDQFSICFLGEFNAFAPYYDGVSHYHDNLVFVASDASYLSNLDNHQSPFLSQTFS